jgi:hypothetical protein
LISRRSALRAGGAAVATGAAVAAGLTLSHALGSSSGPALGTPSAPALGNPSALAPAPGPALVPASPGAELTSTFFATAFTEYYGSLATASDGDLWPGCWADDDNMYCANGDGTGFASGAAEADVVVSQIAGTLRNGLTGTRLAAGADVANLWADPGTYNRKPTGMACAGGVLYLAVQDLRRAPSADAFNDAPNASVSVSADHGRTWRKTSAPLFTNGTFTTIWFLDFGRDSAEAKRALGTADGSYLYAYGLDGNWRDSYSGTVPSPVSVYLARVTPARVQDASAWQFFTGTSRGRPSWGPLAARVPALTDTRRLYPELLTTTGLSAGPANLSVISQGGVVYNAPLRRYLYTSWTEYTFEFYEAPAPWGPWRLFFRHDVGGYPWFGTGGGCDGPKNGGYATTIPSKFISADGRAMWLQSNWWGNSACGATNYTFSLRAMTLAPYRRTAAVNGPDPARNLARTGRGVVPIEKSAHYGNWQYYNDGDTAQSEDSWDNSPKAADWWGYLFEQAYRMNRIVYTTGPMFPDGGWFASGLTVQVRQDFRWTNVTGLTCTPAYPGDHSAGSNTSYTLTFDPVQADGVAIIGTPGGRSTFTSIAELAVYYDG